MITKDSMFKIYYSIQLKSARKSIKQGFQISNFLLY